MRRLPSPVVARYLLARLRPLTRPVFWGPSIALMLVILFTWQYWMRPEWMSYFGVDSRFDQGNGLSPDDQAIGADIDTLPLLFNDFKLSPNSASKQPDLTKIAPFTSSTDLANLPKIPIPGSSTTAQSQPSNDSGLGNGGNAFSGIMQQFGLPADGSPGNPALSEVTGATSTQPQGINNLLSFPPVSVYKNSPGQAESKNSSGTDLSATSANNRPSQTPSSFTSIAPTAPIEGTTSLGGFGVNAAPTTNPYTNSYTGNTPTTNPYTNSYTSVVEGTQPFSGSTAPPVGAPSIAPISSPSVPSYLSPQPLNSSLNAAPSLVPQQSQVPINDAPFTVPRPIPGRVLGGGEINTFSNP